MNKLERIIISISLLLPVVGFARSQNLPSDPFSRTMLEINSKVHFDKVYSSKNGIIPVGTVLRVSAVHAVANFGYYRNVYTIDLSRLNDDSNQVVASMTCDSAWLMKGNIEYNGALECDGTVTPFSGNTPLIQ